MKEYLIIYQNDHGDVYPTSTHAANYAGAHSIATYVMCDLGFVSKCTIFQVENNSFSEMGQIRKVG